MLIFRISRSEMYFKIGVLKSFAILEPLSNKVADISYRTPTVAASEIFATANTFFKLSLVFTADSRTCFCSGLL